MLQAIITSTTYSNFKLYLVGIQRIMDPIATMDARIDSIDTRVNIIDTSIKALDAKLSRFRNFSELVLKQSLP